MLELQRRDTVVPSWAQGIWRRVFHGSDVTRRVCVVARDYSEKRDFDAIRKEAEALYRGLCGREGLSVRLVSLEARRTRASIEDGVWYIPLASAKKHLGKWQPDLLHVFEAGLHFLFGADLSGFKTVFHSAGLDPLTDLSSDQVDEVVHLSDHDDLFVIVHAEASAERLAAAGVRNAIQGFPLVEFSPPAVPPLRPDIGHDGLVVGFASLPFEEEHLQARGFGVVLELAKRRPDLTIRLANRSPAIAPRLDHDIQATGVRNVHVETGRVPMEEFYRSLDAYILPFTHTRQTHGFPFSVVEAALRGVPVVVSSRSGIAPFVERHAIGVVREPTPEAFADGCDVIAAGWTRFRRACEELRLAIPPCEQRLEGLVKVHDRLDGEHVPSLNVWGDAVRRCGRVFVRTAHDVRDHYRHREVVAQYTEERFLAFPHDEDARQELDAVRAMIAGHPGNGRPSSMRILDLATGNGRIICGLAEGYRVALDASYPMLQAVGARGDTVGRIQSSLSTGALPFPPETFDAVTCFRLIRHLSFPYRLSIYRTVAELLRPGGLLIFDAPDRASEMAIRRVQGWGRYPVYDVFWSEAALEDEIARSPLVLKEKRGIGRAHLHGVGGAEGLRPVRWVVACQKP